MLIINPLKKEEKKRKHQKKLSEGGNTVYQTVTSVIDCGGYRRQLKGRLVPLLKGNLAVIRRLTAIVICLDYFDRFGF